MAWRWLPESPVRVPDTNNASDGDLFRAWALLLASERFLVPEYRERAAAIAADLAARCIAEGPDGTLLLLPAAEGFRTAEGVIVNPAYAMPLALEALRGAVERINVRYGEKSLPRITISVGVAVHPEDGTMPQQLMKAADDALYDAKGRGRNQAGTGPFDNRLFDRKTMGKQHHGAKGA